MRRHRRAESQACPQALVPTPRGERGHTNSRTPHRRNWDSARGSPLEIERRLGLTTNPTSSLTKADSLSPLLDLSRDWSSRCLAAEAAPSGQARHRSRMRRQFGRWPSCRITLAAPRALARSIRPSLPTTSPSNFSDVISAQTPISYDLNSAIRYDANSAANNQVDQLGPLLTRVSSAHTRRQPILGTGAMWGPRSGYPRSSPSSSGTGVTSSDYPRSGFIQRFPSSPALKHLQLPSVRVQKHTQSTRFLHHGVIRPIRQSTMPHSVNQRFPSGPAVMKLGERLYPSLAGGSRNSTIVPLGVIRPIRLP